MDEYTDEHDYESIMGNNTKEDADRNVLGETRSLLQKKDLHGTRAA
jgi:hypothetical protein